jgi:hypothetical protein
MFFHCELGTDHDFTFFKRSSTAREKIIVADALVAARRAGLNDSQQIMPTTDSHGAPLFLPFFARTD